MAVGLVGCNATPVTTVISEHASEATVSKCYGEWPKVDALIIVDGSPSMAETAKLTALNGHHIGELYARRDVTVNYRVAIIDSQVAQPGCEVAPDHAGRFIDTSCRERLDDFVVEASIEGPGADVRAEGCTDACELETLVTLPSRATWDDTPRPRPWIESRHHVTNLPADIKVGDDLACRFPTGVSGCTFEAPLEAMRAAIARTQDPDDPAFGFLRPDAVLFVMFVTDEIDCSLRSDIDTLTDAFGSETPTSAECWTSGVECDGASPYSSCRSTVDSPLRPVEEYAELLREINDAKLARLPGVRSAVVVSAVTGVTHDGPHYADAPDEEWMSAFGVGPGCESEHAKAVPPVRLFEFTEEFGEPAQWGASSALPMCDPSWAQAIACFPGPDVSADPCVDLCVADIDPSTPQLEIDCRIDWTDPDGVTLTLPRCTDEHELPEGSDACGQVLSPNENTERCAVESKLDFTARFHNRAGAGCLSITCQTSPQEICDQRQVEAYFPDD